VTMKENIDILVVDDDPEARRSIAEMLEMAGYRVSSVTCGAEALEYLQENKADLVLCDVLMPEMDGFAVLKNIKREYPWINVVMVAANGDASAVRWAFRLGADEFITKPFEAQDLGLIIERVGWHLVAE